MRLDFYHKKPTCWFSFFHIDICKIHILIGLFEYWIVIYL